MESTNGYGPKRAILYARVSTEEQARSGYSLAQQMEALRAYATREGYEIVEEVSDPGQSGASLERPGMDRVRDLVATGDVSVVLAQDRDRFAREPAYHYLLRREFEEHNCKLKALNDRGDDSPEGELTDGILDQLAKFERAKTAERTRRGKLRKAREGKIIAGKYPTFGFKFNDARNGYEVDEETMPIVRHIFHLVADGTPLHAVKKRLEREGVPAPKGGKYWSRSYIRRVVNEDSYKPHTLEEIKALVSPEVASELDCSLDYGIWWFNQYRAQVKRGQSRKFSRKPREEWIAVPVVDAGIPREWVDAAREAIDGNYRPPRTTRRIWELAGGVLFCGECGRRMIGHTVSAKRKNGTKLYHYYICPRKGWEYNRACPNRSHRAEEMETLIWSFTSGMLCAPDQLEAGLDRMIARERDNSSGDSDREAKVWLEKLAEADRMRSGYQELAAKGLMSHEELGERLGQLGETRKTAERELEAVRERQERVEKLERDKDILLESYTTMVPEALNELAAQERYQVYKMLRLRVVVGTDGSCEVTGVLGEDLSVCTSGPTSTCSVSSTLPRPR